MQNIDISQITGLSPQEAADRLVREGPNELPSTRKRSIPGTILDVVKEPMFILLVGAGFVYFFLGDIEEGAMLLSFVLVIIGITAYQEQKTENALNALRNLSSPRALVIRKGEPVRIPGREVVPGDVLFVAEGDRIAADAVVYQAINLTVDESILTGESAPVRKLPSEGNPSVTGPGGDDQPYLYSGTLVVQGQGLALVHATGLHTEMGKIGKALQSVDREETALHLEISRIVTATALTGLGLCALIVIVYGVTRLDWIGGLLAGITLAMAILPEEFPVVLTIFLALGAWRMSRHQVLTRKAAAIEALGSVTVLCVDKTGTLTENRMSVCSLWTPRDFMFPYPGRERLPEDLHELAEFAILASKKNPFDPMEKALVGIGETDLSGTDHVHRDWQLAREYPLSKQLLAMSNVWISPDGTEYVIAAKGAPEAIGDLCHLNGEALDQLNEHVERMAGEGLRILGVAKASFTRTGLPDGQHDFAFVFLGLIGFADPVRADVPGAIQECANAGIRVVMITGDYPATALYIARQIGLSEKGLLTGPDLEQMDDTGFAAMVRDVTIYARVVPEQKLRIVETLKRAGEVVAMTGDGVNDAPALKSAHIGIAMGGRGTDVAREASSLVLLDDTFPSIVAGIRMGRRIYDNLKKAVAYILSTHIPIAGMSLAPVLLGWPLILLPVHIVFLELIIDPACSVVFENEPDEPDVMKRPPRPANTSVFGRRVLGIGFMQGILVFLIVLFVYINAVMRGLGDDSARALAFTTIVIANIGLIFTNRSWSGTVIEILRIPNKALWLVTGGAFFFLGLVLSVPFLQGLFRFGPIGITDLAVAIGAGFISVGWFEFVKLVQRRRGSERYTTYI
ncbi:MAG: cation-translocating P-type ATPase [Methanoregulaceae archaeon]|nr:cation-translocating P-type ATPase [Methanoregulaceae archaeon]